MFNFKKKRLEDYAGTCKPAQYMSDGVANIFYLNVGLVNGRGMVKYQYFDTDYYNYRYSIAF